MSGRITYQTGTEHQLTTANAMHEPGIRMLEHAGCTVILEDASLEYVVKIRVPGHRQIRQDSTSGYPFDLAFRKAAELLRNATIATVHFHDHNGEAQPPRSLIGDGVLLPTMDCVVGFKTTMGGDLEVVDCELPGRSLSLIGLRSVYLVVEASDGSIRTMIPSVREIVGVGK